MARKTKIQGLDKLKRKLTYIPVAAKEAAHKGVLAGAYQIAETQRLLAPVDDGDLVKSIVVTPPNTATPPYSQPGGSMVTGPEQAVITAGNTKVRYAHLVEFGTKPHVIEPKDGKTPMGKGGVFGTHVDHPGAKANPFFWPGYRAVRSKARGQMTRRINKAIKEAAIKGGT